MNIYYEMLTPSGKLYYSEISVATFDRTSMKAANRAWCEENNKVTYWKNRPDSAYNLCDMEEFMWIKLRCKPL